MKIKFLSALCICSLLSACGSSYVKIHHSGTIIEKHYAPSSYGHPESYVMIIKDETNQSYSVLVSANDYVNKSQGDHMEFDRDEWVSDK
jgi:hypothetical protein